VRTQARLRTAVLSLALTVVVAAAAAAIVYAIHSGKNANQAGSSTTSTSQGLGAGSTSTTGTPASTATNVSNTSQPVTATLQVVTCPTSYGVTPPPAPKSIPNTLDALIPQSLAGQLSVYADQAGIMDVLGPTGWKCTASFGADGSGGISITPSGEVLPSTSSLPSGSPIEAIIASQNGGCQGCASVQACPFFAAAATADPGTCPAKTPAEAILKLAPNLVSILDPPGVSGSADPSGGSYPANAVLTYTEHQGQSGTSVSSWLETCTLPNTEKGICTAVLNDFITRYKNS
jgi:hypothetical protein